MRINSLLDLEAAEAALMHAIEAEASPETRRRFGIRVASVGGGVVLAARTARTGYWNRAVGFPGPITSDLVGEVLDRYRAWDVGSAILDFAPDLLPPDWPAIAAKHGLEERPGIVKLAGRLDDITTPARTSLHVAPISDDVAPAWAGLVMEVFGMTALAPLMQDTAHHPNFRPYGAWDGDTLVGGANLYLYGDVAVLNSGATLPGNRGRGIQSALIAARTGAAREAGCTWLVGDASAGAPGPSLRNLLRAGLTPLYTRADWVWQNPSRRRG